VHEPDPFLNQKYGYRYVLNNGCRIVVDVIVVEYAFYLSQKWYLLFAALCP
jgi:hypothetical protein